MLFAAFLVAILAIFPHADAGRPFLLRRGESVSPAVKFETEITMSRVRAVGSAIAGSLALAPSLALSPRDTHARPLASTETALALGRTRPFLGAPCTFSGGTLA
jgi:hypothetical protein